MQKIITLFQRNYDSDRLVRNEVTPGAEWVFNNEGTAYRKWDGTCCMVRDRKLYKRYDAKKGKEPPLGFEPAQDPDPITGHWPGWILVTDTPENRWHLEAEMPKEDGTYELIGTKINRNPERVDQHMLISHKAQQLTLEFLDFEFIRNLLEREDIEGIVWHHNQDTNKMVKIKKKDFGFKR